MDFQIFHEGGQGSNHKVRSHGLTEPCNVLLSYTKNGNKEVNECSAQFWWSPGGSTRGMHWKS